MEYSTLLAYSLAADLRPSRGSGDLDWLSDYMLQDMGYRRVGGRIVKDEAPFDQPAVQGRKWSWAVLVRRVFKFGATGEPATLA